MGRDEKEKIHIIRFRIETPNGTTEVKEIPKDKFGAYVNKRALEGDGFVKIVGDEVVVEEGNETVSQPGGE